jgi:3-oxoacyl-[acyl-carrier protein] reductase
MSEVCLVSGGTRGLGQALVASFLDAGLSVATYGRTRTPFIDEAERTHGDRLLFAAVDAAETTAVERFAADTAQRFGRIDVLVNNAGIMVEGLLTLTRTTDVARVLAINLESAIVLARACAKAMLRQRRGHIVNISSVNAVRGHRGIAAYSAAKAGLDGLTRSLARELGPRGIRVNSVAPGHLETDMTRGMDDAQRAKIAGRTPLGRLGTVSDVVGVVQFLLSPAAAFITGQTLVVDGGLTC